MLRIGLGLLLGWLTTTTAFAQTEIDIAERIRLHELLRLSITTAFTLQPKATLPEQNSLQVYLGFGLDFETRQNFVRWLAEWNQKPANRHVNLVITEDLQQAHVVLARYTGTETTILVTNHNPRRPGGVHERVSSQPEKVISVFAYVFVPVNTTPLHLQAIWRGAAEINVKKESAREAGWQLRKAFFSLLKSHLKE